MSVYDKLSEMKFKLNAARKQRLQQERILITQRNEETCLNKEIAITKDDNELLMHRVNELNSELSQMESQLAMIDVCRASEESKVQVYIPNIDHFKNEYEELFQKDNQVIHMQQKKIKQKEADVEEEDRREAAEIQEKNEQSAQEIAAVEREREAIERECCVLTKRNKAIMLKLRKKLIETEDLRRELMKNVYSAPTNDFQD